MSGAAPYDLWLDEMPVFSRILRVDYVLANSEQSRTLAILRGTLLPGE